MKRDSARRPASVQIWNARLPSLAGAPPRWRSEMTKMWVFRLIEAPPGEASAASNGCPSNSSRTSGGGRPERHAVEEPPDLRHLVPGAHRERLDGRMGVAIVDRHPLEEQAVGQAVAA